MAVIIIIGFVMIGINISFSIIELRPFIDAIRIETARTKGPISCMTAPFRILRHIPKLIPTIIDLGGMWILTHVFTLGAGYAGGMAGLFASNLISGYIFWYTHYHTKQIRKLTI